ncbi:hypothetical protein FOZ63_026397 [Perkinsus olseni]|uniref:Uncharacterized protein n=1 Tax=Perkinsus olseni TaxID=32597 RepID=A0A7J6QHY0_PEROL|nr:hypothetical protein FOZ63_026397 [Perkinsus olseni]
MIISLLLFFSLLELACGSNDRKRVQAVTLPAGTYKAIEVYGSVVSPPFPNLTDFEMLVTMGDSGSRARFTARGLDPASPDGQWSSSSQEVDLVWYSGDVVSTLRKLGSLEVDKARRCLHAQPKGNVNHFVEDLAVFLRSGRPPPPGKLFFQLIICETEAGLAVGIGRNGTRRWHSSEYGFLLAPNPVPSSWHDKRGVLEPSRRVIPME